MKKIILLTLLLSSQPLIAKEDPNLEPQIGKIESTGLKHDFASAEDLKKELSRLKASEQSLKELVKKQQELLETYERIIEKLKQQLEK